MVIASADRPERGSGRRAAYLCRGQHQRHGANGGAVLLRGPHRKRCGARTTRGLSSMTEGTTSTQLVYFFGAGQAEGGVDLKHLVGGKGASLADMTKAGLNVPP